MHDLFLPESLLPVIQRKQTYLNEDLLDHELSLPDVEQRRTKYPLNDSLYIRRTSKDKRQKIIFFPMLQQSLKYFVNKTGVSDVLDSNLSIRHVFKSPCCPTQSETVEFSKSFRISIYLILGVVFRIQTYFSSHEQKVKVSFSGRLVSVVRPSVCLNLSVHLSVRLSVCKLFTCFTSSLDPKGQM